MSKRSQVGGRHSNICGQARTLLFPIDLPTLSLVTKIVRP